MLAFRTDVERNQKEVSVTLKKMDKLLHKVKKFKNEISNAKSEYITILSIFAAVMVACIGGVSCFGNTGKSLMEASMYRFFVFISFVGLVIGNVTFILLYMVARITDKKIYVNCECASNRDKNDECGVCACNISCSSLQRIKNRLPYIFWYNIVCIVVIVIGICIEHLVLKYVIADWVLILFTFLIVGLSIKYGLK